MIKIGPLTLPACPLLLAPMEDVSDPPFRAVCKEGGADLMYTEFIASEGLIRHAEPSVQKLDIYPEEQPVGIQIFGDKIESMQEAAAIAEEAGPALLDINYGCPVRKVACKGAGAGILLDLPKMEAMTRAIVQQVSLPVTVKTRLGWDVSTIRIVEVAQRLQDAGIQALTIHARTREQMYRGEADWSWLAKVKKEPSIHIPIFGNGDITSPQKAKEHYTTYGVDGLMVGRGAIGYPWIFREIRHYMQTGELLPPPTLHERMHALRTHLSRSIVWKGERRGILEMRRHYAGYLRGVNGAKKYCPALVQATEAAALYTLFDLMEEGLSSSSFVSEYGS